MAPLTQSQVISGATETMLQAGYLAADLEASQHLVRLFEDVYGVVAIAFFSDWTALAQSWPDAQGELVEILSQALDRSEPKVWEGYLVLITPEPASPEQAREMAIIRKDINRVRKLVITGEDLSNLSALRSALLPVLPMTMSEAATTSSGLFDALPVMLADSSGIPPRTTAALIDAFLGNEPLMEAIDREIHGS